MNVLSSLENGSAAEAQVSRRGLMKFAMVASAAIAAGRLALNAPEAFAATAEQAAPAAPEGPFKLPPLMYPYKGLQPVIGEQTMRIHHDKHHQAYVDKLNAAVAAVASLAGKSADQLVMDLNSVPENIRDAVRNNGGGHVNHTMFWEIMKPKGGGAPTGDVAEGIKAGWGSFDEFKAKFNEAGEKRFGSGWVWLVSEGGKFKIITTPNQDNPLSMGLFPVLGNDVWEHAYYLNYQNKRGEYLKAWWNVVNWDAVNNRLKEASKLNLKA